MQSHLVRAIGMAALLIAILAAKPPAEAATKYVNLTFNLVTPVTLNEPIVMDVSTTSNVPYAIACDFGFRGTDAFVFNIVAPDGKELLQTNQSGLADNIRVYLQPKEQYSQRILLNRFYSFEAPGVYHVSVAVELPIITTKTDLSTSKRPVPSDYQVEKTEFDLTILPRNEDVLKERCEALINKWQSLGEFSAERTPIVHELTYIIDPIAIPYLAKLLQSKWGVTGGLNALRQIGTDEAFEAIIPATQSDDKNTAAYAKSLLRERVSKIRNADIRAKIEAAIK